MVSELANTVLDIAVMRENSEYQSYISELEKNGMSRMEAEKEAFFQFFGKNILMAGAGGAISGAAMGGGASAISGINTAINKKSSAENSGGNVRLTSADMQEYIKTGRRQHTRDEKVKLINAGESPILYSEEDIKKFVNDSIKGKMQGEVRAYGKVGERLAKDVHNIDPDTDIYGKYLELTSDKLKHAFDRHSKSAQTGNINLAIKDFENIAEYIDNYDYVLSVEEHNKAKKYA